MLEVKSINNKRASRRYTYLPQARFRAQNISQAIQIRDISKSGLQFFSNATIRPNSPLVVAIEDQTFGQVTPFLLVVRKIDQHFGLLRYNYGSQFFNLRQDTKICLEKILQSTRDEETRANQVLVQKVSSKALLELINEGRSFLLNLIKGNDPEKVFVRFTRDLKDYEKNAFAKSDDESQMIQRLTTHNFHCSLLNTTTPFVNRVNAKDFDFYKQTVKKIQLITDSVIDAKKFSSSLVAESANRLHYNKLELLQTFVETYQSENDSQSEEVKRIVDEYRQTSPKPSKATPRR